MDTKKTVIAISIAALFAAPVAAFAKDQWEFHEEQWNNVMSYGNVPLAQDSSGTWGPWSEFIAPAAGGPVVNPALFVGAGTGERYRPNPQIPEQKKDEPPKYEPPVVPPVIPPVVDACGAGAWCGYAVYSNDSYSVRTGYPDGGEGTAKLALHLKPADSSLTPGSGKSSGTVEFNFTHLNGAAPFQTTTGVLPAEFGNFSSEGLHEFSAYPDNYSTGAEGYPHNYSYWWGGLPTNNDEVAVGWFRIQQYVSGGEQQHNTFGFYVAGIQTPQTYLDSQAVGKVNGVGYYGYSVDMGVNKTPVAMTVNFGSGTWSGSWNGGQDGSVSRNNNSAGTKYVTGEVGFNASGTISGANIQSTSITALDGTIDAAKSSVQGTFFGKEAGSIGGAHQIVKSANNEKYMNNTNVGVFLVNKGAPPPTPVPAPIISLP